MGTVDVPAEEPHRGYRFGAFVLDIDRATLFEHGDAVKLRRQSFDVLRFLVEHAGRLVKKQELLEKIWGNAAVTDDSLTHCLIDIRKAIGDTKRELVRTVPRRGFIFDVPVEPLVQSGLQPSGQRRLRGVLRIAVLVLLGLGIGYLSIDQSGTMFEASQLPDAVLTAPNSVAVLPFVDMTESQNYAYFGDGLAEEILNSLAQNSTLQVIARTSSFSYREAEHDVATIARELRVANVLEGSVRVENGRARITAQLVNGETGMHLWSDTFDHELDDVLAVQAEIADAVTQVLAARFLGRQASRADDQQNGAAYDLYLQARFLFHRRASGDLMAARGLYLQAIDLEPDFAKAWAGLAGTYAIEYAESAGTDTALLQQLKGAAERAVAVDPGLAEGWVRLGYYYYYLGDTESSDRYLDRAMAAEPHDALLLSVVAGRFAANGDLDRAIDFQQHALDRDPLSVVNRANLSFFLYAAGRYEEAIRENQRVHLVRPVTSSDPDTLQGHALIQLGRYQDALDVINAWPEGPDRDAATAMARLAMGHKWRASQPIRRLQKGTSVNAYFRLAELRAFCEEIDESFATLGRLRDELIRTNNKTTFEWALYNDVRWSPFLATMRSDSRWQPWLDEVRELTLALVNTESRPL